MPFAAVHKSGCGTSRHLVALHQFNRFRSKADIQRAALEYAPQGRAMPAGGNQSVVTKHPCIPTSGYQDRRWKALLHGRSGAGRVIRGGNLLGGNLDFGASVAKSRAHAPRIRFFCQGGPAISTA